MKMPQATCNLIPKKCIPPAPTKADVNKIVKATGINRSIIETAIKQIKADMRSPSKRSRAKGKRKRSSSRKKQKGGWPPNDTNQNRLTTLFMILLAGGAVWGVVPLLESWLVGLGMLPIMCEQNMIMHVGLEAVKQAGWPVETCPERSFRYNSTVAGFMAILTATGFVTRENIAHYYNESHAYIKAKLFGTAEQQAAALATLQAAGGTRQTPSNAPVDPGSNQPLVHMPAAPPSSNRQAAQSSPAMHNAMPPPPAPSKGNKKKAAAKKPISLEPPPGMNVPSIVALGGPMPQFTPPSHHSSQSRYSSAKGARRTRARGSRRRRKSRRSRTRRSRTRRSSR